MSTNKNECCNICFKLRDELNKNIQNKDREIHISYSRYCYVLCMQLKDCLDPFEVLRIITSPLGECQKINNEKIRKKIEKIVKCIKLKDILKGFFDNEVHNCISKSLEKIKKYFNQSIYNYRIFIKDFNNSSLLIMKKDDRICFDLLPRIRVYNLKPDTDSVITRSRCPLPAWIKGYLRQVLHKITFVNILNQANYDQRIMKKIFKTYALILNNDEKGIFIEVERNKGALLNILNIVGLLLGSSDIGSYINVDLVEDDGCLCKYIIGADKTKLAKILSVLYKTLEPVSSSNDYYEKIRSVVLNLDKVLVLLIPCIANAAECTLGTNYMNLDIDPRYRFLPLTARYPDIYNILSEEYVYSIVPSSPDTNIDYDELLGDFMEFIDLYARYYVEEIRRKVSNIAEKI